MSTAPPLVVEQAIYGSRSGDRDYRVLATSTRFSREEQDALEQFANLGGTALSAETVEPIFLSFPLGAGARPERSVRWAFARGVVLSRGVRGNDYLVHALILDRATLAALRGDLFLLAERARFASEKPSGETLPSLPLDPQEIGRAAARALGSDLTGGLTLAHLAPLLSTLTEAQALAAQLTDGAFATALVRAMLSALPPDDRIGFAFTTRFCQPRALPFRFAAFVQEDRDLATRFLGEAVRPLAASATAVASWLATLAEAGAVRDGGLEPVVGLSVLNDAEGAARLAPPLLALANAEGEKAAAERDVAAFDRARSIALATANASLPRLARQRIPNLARQLRDRAGDAWRLKNAPLLWDTAHSTAEQLSALGTGPSVATTATTATTAATAATAAATPRALTELHQALLQTAGGVSRQTADLALALFEARAYKDSTTAPFRGRLGADAVFPTPRDAAVWITELLHAAEGFGIEILGRWFTRWREVEGEKMLFPLAEILIELPAELSLTPILAALEAAAPTESEARQSWFGALFEILRDPLGPRFPLPFAARLAADEGLLGALEPDDLEAVAPVLAAQMPRLLDAARLAALPAHALAALASACSRGLTHEPRWDLVQLPERARLVERLVVALAQSLAPETLALVRSALGRSEVAREPLRTALETVLRTPRAALSPPLPTGGTAAAVRLLAQLRSRLGGRPSFTALEFSEVRARALRDARECAPSGAGWPVLIWLEAIRT